MICSSISDPEIAVLIFQELSVLICLTFCVESLVCQDSCIQLSFSVFSFGSVLDLFITRCESEGYLPSVKLLKE